MHKWKTRENISSGDEKPVLFLCSRLINFADTMSEWYGHPRVLGIPISKTVNVRLVIWESPLTLTLTQIAKVVWEGDAHMTRVLGMEMLKTRECPYHCDNDYLGAYKY